MTEQLIKIRSNKKYEAKMRDVLADADKLAFGISLSAPAKIAGSKKRAFSLPAGPEFTCPGATEACVSCYAQSKRHMFANVQKSFARNLATISFFESTGDVDGCADAILKEIKSDFDIFRIHESGDFYSQFYLDVWVKVVQARPNTAFWFYTRSFDLDFSAISQVPNVTGWASTDQYNAELANQFAAKFGFKQAFGPIERESDKPAGSVVCPVTSSRLKLDGACEKCKLCIHKDRTKKNIAFIKH